METTDFSFEDAQEKIPGIYIIIFDIFLLVKLGVISFQIHNNFVKFREALARR